MLSNFHLSSAALTQKLMGVALPIAGLLVFLVVWNLSAQKIETSLGQFPGPAEVWEQGGNLVTEHQAQREKAAAFYERQAKRNAEKLARNPDYVPKQRRYTGKPTFFDQIGTSLVTVMLGFLLAAAIAVPIGIMIGLSQSLYSAMNPLIQLLKPVSPLAWLPLVTMVVSAVYVSDDPTVPKSFLNSMITVMLCCIWPTIINTAVGVSGVSQDHVNVSRVLRLGPLTHVY